MKITKSYLKELIKEELSPKYEKRIKNLYDLLIKKARGDDSVDPNEIDRAIDNLANYTRGSTNSYNNWLQVKTVVKAKYGLDTIFDKFENAVSMYGEQPENLEQIGYIRPVPPSDVPPMQENKMKITKSYLKKIIKEELNKLTEDAVDPNALGARVSQQIKTNAAKLGNDGSNDILVLGAALNKLARIKSYQADPSKQDLVGTVKFRPEEQSALDNPLLKDFLNTANMQQITQLQTAIFK